MPAKYGLGTDKPKSSLRWLYLPFMLLLGIASMALATQRIAAFFSYHPALGEAWGVVWGIPWYAPWSVFAWQEQFGPGDTYGFIEQAITHSQALFLVPQFIVIAYWMAFMKKLKANANLHGSARWAEEKEIRTMGYFEGKGVYVGGWLKKYAGISSLLRALRSKPDEVQLYLRHNGPEHIMVFAPTRSGKGVGLILPTLLAWEGSSIVLDIKGENWSLTGGWRKSQDQVVLRFDPSDPSGASAAFNPLEELRIDTMMAIPDVQNMAAMLVDPNGKGLEDHWSKAAFAMLGGAILHCCIMIRSSQGRTATLYDLSCMLADESRTIQDLFKEMVEAPHEKILKEMFPESVGGDKAHIFIASSAREMLNKAENDTSDFKQFVEARLFSEFNILHNVLTAWKLDTVRPNTRPLLVHLLVRFWRSFRHKIAGNKGISPSEGKHEIDRYFRKTQARKRQSPKTFGRRRAVSLHNPARKQIVAFWLQVHGQTKTVGCRAVPRRQPERSAGTPGSSQKVAAGQYRPQRRQTGSQGGCSTRRQEFISGNRPGVARKIFSQLDDGIQAPHSASNGKVCVSVARQAAHQKYLRSGTARSSSSGRGQRCRFHGASGFKRVRAYISIRHRYRSSGT